MVRKIALAVVLMSIAGVASASNSSGCWNFFGIEICPWPTGPKPSPVVNAPEIDPSSALAGLTLMAGGLAVLRGRRTKKITA